MIFAFCIVCLKITANALAKAPSLSLIFNGAAEKRNVSCEWHLSLLSFQLNKYYSQVVCDELVMFLSLPHQER